MYSSDDDDYTVEKWTKGKCTSTATLIRNFGKMDGNAPRDPILVTSMVMLREYLNRCCRANPPPSLQHVSDAARCYYSLYGRKETIMDPELARMLIIALEAGCGDPLCGPYFLLTVQAARSAI